MRKTFVVARREYQAMVRTKTFLITMVMMPLFMVGGILLQGLLQGRIDIDDKKLVVLDRTGQIFDALVESAQRHNESDIFDDQTGKQVRGRIILQAGPTGPVSNEQRLALSQRVKKQEIYAFVEIDAEALQADGPGEKPAAVYYSQRMADRQVRRWFRQALNGAVHRLRLREAGLDPALVSRAIAPVAVEQRGLYIRTKTGQIRKGDEGSRVLAFFVPMGVMMLMFMSIMVVTQPMLQCVLEEKQQRIAEVLLGCANPFQLMMGKVAGNVAVSLTIVAVYLLGGYGLARHFDYTDFIPFGILGWFFVYEVMAVMLFGSIFVAIGAACTEVKEAQNLLMPVMLLLVLPMMVWFNVLEDPTGRFATWVSFFPPVTPMMMVLRMTATTAVPLWQPLAGIVVVLLTTLVCVFAAGRVFRIGILSYGKAPKVSELIRWVLRG